jgi:protein phosphatase
MVASDRSQQLEVGQFSHPGRKRSNNEDWLGTFQPEDARRLSTKGSLFLVADGMGGHKSGELASRRAVDHVVRVYMDDPTPDVAASLQHAVKSANATLYTTTQGQSDRRRSGTTLVAAVVRHDRLWIANVGDSRAYLLRNRELSQISQDHSWAAAGAEGVGRHVITRALGLRPEVEVDIYKHRLQSGDRILLCSDGLTTPVPEAEILAIARRHPSQAAAERLVEKANERGGPDNVSVILIQFGDRGPTFQPQVWLQMLLNAYRELEKEAKRRPALFLFLLLLLALILVAVGFFLGLVLFRA